MRDDLTAEAVRSALSYDADSGELRWRAVRNRPLLVGRPAGTFSPKDGYLRVVVAGVSYLAHRLAWLHYHGMWPPQHLDHINGVRTDNRIANLREADHRRNSQNRALAPHNTSGAKGVSKKGRRYQAFIGVDGKKVHLGSFGSLAAAAAAYDAAALEYFGEFRREAARQ